MSNTPFAAFRRIFCAFAAIVFLFTVTAQAHAVLINFDDLTYTPIDPNDPSFDDVPLDNQYLSQGLSISNAYLLSYDLDPGSDPDRISGANYLLAGSGGMDMTLSFVGNLPTFVGMYVGSFSHEMIFADAYGPAGLVASLHTAGDGGPFNDQSPYMPKQYLTFESTTGISRIDMSGWYGSRVSGFVDDITFTYASVPEPSSLLMFGLGALVLVYRRSPKGRPGANARRYA